jgi:hypothetical protein
MQNYNMTQERDALAMRRLFGMEDDAYNRTNRLKDMRTSSAQDVANLRYKDASDQLDNEIENYQLGVKEDGLNYRADLTAAGRTDKNKVDQFKTMWKDAGPEGRKQLASMFSTDPNFQAAFGELTPKEREIESKIDLNVSKTATEDATRPGKVANLNANAEQKKAQTEKLKMEVKLMPEKHKKAMQDIESRITERKRKREKGIGIDEAAEAKDLQAKEKMLGEAYDRVTRYDPSLGMRVPKPGMEARAKQLESLLNDIADEMIENDFQVPMKPPPANLRQTENRLSGTIGSKAKPTGNPKPKGSQSYNDLMNKYGK